MAVVNVKSSLVSNYDAQPRVLSNPWVSFGGDIVETAVVSAAASDSANSTYRVCFMPSGARVTDIQVMNDANTSGTSYKCGVLNNTADGGGVVVAASDQIFFNAVTMASARNVWTSLLFPSILGAGGLVANTTLRVWELLGLAADPFKMYHLVITAVTPGSAGGNMAVQVGYIR